MVQKSTMLDSMSAIVLGMGVAENCMVCGFLPSISSIFSIASLWFVPNLCCSSVINRLKDDSCLYRSECVPIRKSHSTILLSFMAKPTLICFGRNFTASLYSWLASIVVGARRIDFFGYAIITQARITIVFPHPTSPITTHLVAIFEFNLLLK